MVRRPKGGKRHQRHDSGQVPREASAVPAPSRDALARGISHAVNNPLAALLVNLELAMDVLRDDGRDPSDRFREALELLTEVRVAAEHIGTVTKRLQAPSAPTVAPPPASEPSPRLLGESIEGLEILAATTKEPRAKR